MSVAQLLKLNYNKTLTGFSLQIPFTLFWDLASLAKTSLYPSGLAGLETVSDLCLLIKRWEVSLLFTLFLSSTAVLPFQSSNLSNFTRKSDAMTLITPQTEVRGCSTPLTGSPVSQSIKSTTYQGKIKITLQRQYHLMPCARLNQMQMHMYRQRKIPCVILSSYNVTSLYMHSLTPLKRPPSRKGMVTA